MVKLSSIFVSLAVLGAVSASPLMKRIDQTISDSTKKFEAACDAAGGGQDCNTISVNSFSTLLAAAGDCDQQNAADQMIDLAKKLNNDADMITAAQIFAQQPRNSPTSESVPYCQQAPKNQELNGLFQCQFQGTDPTTFVGGVKVGAPGTLPLGLNAPVNPPQSCPAKTDGGVPDGQQLSDLVSSPGVAGAVGGSGSGANNNGGDNSNANANAGADASSQQQSDAGAASPTPVASSSVSNKPFALSNGKAAQQLNAQFATLTADSACQAGTNACVNQGFAQCVNGKFSITDCGKANGVVCAALPLVNSAGTSVTCVDQQQAEQRIADTGATGGLTGSN